MTSHKTGPSFAPGDIVDIKGVAYLVCSDGLDRKEDQWYGWLIELNTGFLLWASTPSSDDEDDPAVVEECRLWGLTPHATMDYIADRFPGVKKIGRITGYAEEKL